MLLSVDCTNDDEPNVGDSRTFTLRADYLFETNGNPELGLILNESDQEIQIENNPTISESQGRINFTFNNVTIKDGQDIYEVNSDGTNFDVITQRFQNGDWNNDDENKLYITPTQSLDVVLVLDVSESLEGNLAVIKERSVQFAVNILQQNPSARIGVVKFSRGFKTLDLTSNSSAIQTFILNTSQVENSDIGNYVLENRPETGLYQAMDTGIDLLGNSNSDGKGLVTFTDGFNNYQTDINYEDSNYVQQRLNNSDVSSYTIGFIGNQNTIETEVLENLAVNGQFAFPQTTEELTNVFNTFSNSVAIVYDFIYDTNNSNQNNITKYRFLIRTTLVSD
jgi:hypothetical protein